LGKVIMFYDANEIQLSTEVDVVTSEDTKAKYEAWGWHVIDIAGNDHNAIRRALKEGKEETKKPTLIIGHTLMGKGVRTNDGDLDEGKVSYHGQPLSKAGASFAETIKGFGGNPEDPFQIHADVAEHYAHLLDHKRADAKKRKNAFKRWRKDNKDLAAKFDLFFSGKLPDLNWSTIEPKPNSATRNASGAVLAFLAENVENVIVSSADLANSDKTEFFLKKSSAFTSFDFSGGFLQAGVSELTMAALCTGMSLHGGVIPACGTFFAFSDYMKPAIRVAALMETPVIFIWTHDAFRVGEDGPTHQPIEQEAQIRLLEKVQNHSHRNSFSAMRPADGAETVACWKMALENRHTPTGLIFSRQNVEDLPGDARREQAELANKGAYIVQNCEGKPDILLIANGSEVSTLVAGAERLRSEKNLKVRVVSAPSEGLFRTQSKKYQREVIPGNVPTFGLTAGLSVTLEGLVGRRGKVWGLNHFGYSAPYKVLDEKFGFTGDNVFEQVCGMLKI